jgi:hypothetical protein
VLHGGGGGGGSLYSRQRRWTTVAWRRESVGREMAAVPPLSEGSRCSRDAVGQWFGPGG